MKKLFLLSFLLLSLSVSAQRIDKPGESYDIYCTVIVNNIISPTIYIGEDKEEYTIMKDNDEKVKFVMGNETITYMTKRGWEFVQFQGSAGHIFRKEVKNDNEAYAHLLLKYAKGANKGQMRANY